MWKHRAGSLIDLLAGPLTPYRAGVLATTARTACRSSFENFVRDEYTVLPEVADRLLSTSIDATWELDPTGTGK